jgi:hypothetical protein
MLRFVKDSDNGLTLTRREWLRLGGLAGLSFLAPGLRAAPPPGPRHPIFGKAKSVILVFTSGGQSHLDMWDPKPQAPEEVRGVFKSISTSVPGTIVTEHLPRVAKLAHLYTIVRNVAHDDLDHGSACYVALTGYFHAQKSANPLPSPEDLPTVGALVQRMTRPKNFPYNAVHVNGPAQIPEQLAPGQFGGVLGRKQEPLIIGNPLEEGCGLSSLEQRGELPPVRVEARKSLLESLDTYRKELERNRAMMDVDELYRQAYELLSAPQCRKAFDLSREPEVLRRRYGMHRPGQACLLARRLVEAGVPYIAVIWNHNNRGQDKKPDDTESYGWDTHNDIFESLRERLLPRFDESFSALLEDLHHRGLLDSTLVVCMGEFGRAPLVALEPTFAGSTPGRKHWAAVYSIVTAGVGMPAGGVLGASDRIGAYPNGNAIGPWDVTATMLAALGIDPGAHYTDPAGRLFQLSKGTPFGT